MNELNEFCINFLCKKNTLFNVITLNSYSGLTENQNLKQKEFLNVV